MKYTPSDKCRIEKQFDSFVKIGLTRKLLNYENKLRRSIRREKDNVVFDDDSNNLFGVLCIEVTDFVIEGLKIVINDECLYEGLISIKDIERRIVFYRDVLQYQVSSIANEMGCSPQYIYRVYNRALRNLREQMERIRNERNG